jgi:hypothetical protein
MFSTAAFRLLSLIPLSMILFIPPALAQFEIAPDHFDSEGKKAATHSTAKNKARPQIVSSAANAAGAAAVRGKTGHSGGSLQAENSTNQDLKGGPSAARKKFTVARRIAAAKPQAQ